MGLLARARHGLLVLATAAALGLPAAVLAQDAGAPRLYEQKIKAGLVYNFLKFTVWPSRNAAIQSGRLRVCLYGEDPFDGYLYPLEGRTARQLSIMISRVRTPGEAAGCSLVYIHRSHEAELPRILAFLKGKSVMTVSDIEKFAEKGGMVELAMQDRRIHLFINPQATQAAGIRIEDRMLKLSTLVAGNG
jgi:hypothetical protein